MNVLLSILLFLLSSNVSISKQEREIRTSIYNPTEAQCDNDPFLTASGIRINPVALKNGCIRYVSVSRNLKKIYPFGTYITVISKNCYYNGKWKVVDTMNKRFTNKIDFLQDVGDKNVPPKKVKIQ